LFSVLFHWSLHEKYGLLCSEQWYRQTAEQRFLFLFFEKVVEPEALLEICNEVWVSLNNDIELLITCSFLWPPCIADADIILCSCGFFFLLFSSPILSGRRLDVYHTFTDDVALVRI